MEMARILNSALLILITAFLIREVYPHEHKRIDVKELKYFSDGGNRNKNWHAFDSSPHRRFGHSAWSKEVGGKEDLEKNRETQAISGNENGKQEFYGGWSFQNEMKSETRGSSNNGGEKKEFHTGFSLSNILHSIVEFVNGLSVDEKKKIIESINRTELTENNNNSVTRKPEIKSEEDDRDTEEITEESSSEEDSSQSRTSNRSSIQENKNSGWLGMYIPKEVFQPKAKEFEFIYEKPNQYDKDFEFKDITSEDVTGFGRRENFFNNREEIFDKPILWKYDDNENKYSFSRNKLNLGFQQNAEERAHFYSKAEHVGNYYKSSPQKGPQTGNTEQPYDSPKNKNTNENFGTTSWPVTIDQASSFMPIQDKPQEWTMTGAVTKYNLLTSSPTKSTSQEKGEATVQTYSITPVQNKSEDETTDNIKAITINENIGKNSSPQNTSQEMKADVDKKSSTIPIHNNTEYWTMVGGGIIKKATTNDILLPTESPPQSTPKIIGEITTESLSTNPEKTQEAQRTTKLPIDYSTTIFSDVNKNERAPNNDMFNGSEFIFFSQGEIDRKFKVLSKSNESYVFNENKKAEQNGSQIEEADREKLSEEKKQQHNNGKHNNERNVTLPTSKSQEVEDKEIPEDTNRDGQQQPPNDNKELFDKPKKLCKVTENFYGKNAPQNNTSPPDSQETKSDGEESSEIDNIENKQTDASSENNSKESEELNERHQTQDDSSIETARTALTVEENEKNIQHQNYRAAGENNTSYQSDELECKDCSENSDEEEDADFKEDDDFKEDEYFFTENETKISAVNVSEQEDAQTDLVPYPQNTTAASLTKNANESKSDNYKPQEAFDTILEYLYQHANSPLLKELKATRNKSITCD